MTAAADIIVKKADGATDITWTVIAASGGDKSAAIWRSNSANSGTVGQKPTFTLVAKNNQAGDVRRCDIQANFPGVYTNTSTGQTEVRSKGTFSASFAVPQNMTSTDIGEFVYQVANLVASNLVKTAVYNGYAPT